MTEQLDLPDFTDAPDYQAFVEHMAQYCHCAYERPCPGVLAGGLCDDVQDDEAEDEQCPNCSGTGSEPYDDFTTPCDTCEGTGHL